MESKTTFQKKKSICFEDGLVKGAIFFSEAKILIDCFFYA